MGIILIAICKQLRVITVLLTDISCCHCENKNTSQVLGRRNLAPIGHIANCLLFIHWLRHIHLTTYTLFGCIVTLLFLVLRWKTKKKKQQFIHEINPHPPPHSSRGRWNMMQGYTTLFAIVTKSQNSCYQFGVVSCISDISLLADISLIQQRLLSVEQADTWFRATPFLVAVQYFPQKI